MHRAITLLTSTNSLLQLDKVTRLAPELVNAKALASSLGLTLLRGWTTQPDQFPIQETHLTTLFTQLSL